jgi:Outer membrane protein beta-barrel domain
VSGNYSIKGISFLNASASAVLNISYIDLPVLLKANFNGLQIFAGPQVSYLMGARLNTKASVAGINVFNNSMDASSQLNKWDAGVTGGIGYQFANGLRINAAYERGLSKLDQGKNTSAYNQGFKIGAAFSF